MKRYISLLLAVVMLLSAMPVVGVSAADPELASVSVTSDKWRLIPGETAQLTAEALDIAGDPIVGATFNYMSMDESIASVDNKGLVTSKTYGVIEILVKASYGGVTIPKLVKLTVADATDREDFETEPGSVLSSFASGSTMVAVSDEAGKNSAMSAKLYDTSTQSAALLRYETSKSKSLKLVFDVLPKSGNIQFRISNGARGTANTAFWIQLTSNQAKYYDGKAVKWVNFGEPYDSISNKWTSITVEATVDKTAKVYINGKLIGETPRTDGDYGKNAVAMIDSVVFECGDAGTTGSLFYIDNLRLAPPLSANGETFDKLDLNATPESVPGYVSHNSVTVKTAPGSGSNKALMLVGNKDNTAVPSFTYQFESYSKLSLEFDVYLENANTTVTWQILDGAKTTANTAFWMQFNHVYGLRVYDGKWNNVNESVRLLEKEWNKVRLEITNGKNPELKVYLNGKYVSSTKVAFNKKDTVDGISLYTGAKEQSCYLDNLKVTGIGVETFDDLVKYATPETLDGYAGHKATTVQADPINKDQQSLRLYDTAIPRTTTPEFQYMFDSTSDMSMEFDVYIENPSTTVSFYFYNNTKSFAAAAFCLSFNPAYGLRPYVNGAAPVGGWKDPINAEAKLPVNKWNKVRVDLTTGENAEATIYLNGTKLGTTKVTCTNQATVNGFNIYLGSKDQSAYLDNLKLTAAPRMEVVTPDPIEENFESESLEMYAPADSVSGISSYKAAVVKPASGRTGNALWLGDAAKATTPEVNYTFAATDKLTMEFDINALDTNSLGTLRIYNGSLTTANTALWLNFNYQGLRYYDGTWKDFVVDAVTTANTWIKVRIELTTGANGEAKIYFDDVLKLTVPAPTTIGNSAATVNAACFQAANANKSFYLDNLKVTPAAAKENFEALEVGTDLATVLASNTTLAAVANMNGNKVANVYDSAAADTAILRYATAASNALDVSFDVLPVQGNVLFRLSNGTRTNGNLAYWFRISGNKVAYYAVNGAGANAWIDIGSFTASETSEWIAVQVKGSLTTGKAQVYVNGALLGEASRCNVSGYGSNVTTTMDSLIFAAGGNNVTGQFYVDNLKLVPASVEETFDEVELVYASPEKLDGYTAHNSAAVKTEPGVEGNKAHYLFDSTAADYPHFHYTFDSYNKLTLEFDVYPTASNNAITFQILNGARSDANTAFYLQFGSSGLRAYDGTWNIVNADAKLNTNNWNKVSVQLTTGENAEAIISLNGTVVGTTDITRNTQETVNGIYLFMGNKEHSCYIDNLKVTPAPVAEDFESMANGAVPSGTVSDVNMVTVSNAKAAPGGSQSAYMADTVANQTSLMSCVTNPSAYLEVEFDVMPVSGTVQFRISNGARNGPNTGYWIHTVNRNVNGVYNTFLQYYNGSAWVDLCNLGDSNALWVNKWHNIRMEANAVGNANVYIDGTFVAEAPHCSGSYGTNATTAIDRLIIECGDGTYATCKFYVDNLKLSSPVEETFDAVATDAAPETVTGYLGHYAATVQPAPGAEVNNILELTGSSANSTAPSFHYSFGQTKDVTVDFKVNPLNSSAVTLQVLSGARADANTAFYLQFSSNGLRVYNGAWAVVNADAKLTANAWNDVSLEITGGETPEAKIYLNDQLVGTTQVAFNKKETVDGIFICTGAATQSAYIDDLKIAPGSYEELVTPDVLTQKFEDVELSASPETLPGYVAHQAAAVKTDPSNAKNEALHLYDSTGTKNPYFECTYASTKNLTLEFDAYIPDANNTISFQIYNGSKAYANTVFFLSFNHQNGLQVYNGQWNVINENVKLTPNKWNKIRVEITAGDSAKAKIYLDGKEVGTTQIAYNKKATVDGFYIFAGSKTQSVYLDNLKITAPVTENFNSLAVNATPEKLPGYVNADTAVAKADPGVNKALYLYDSTGKNVPYFDYAFDDYSKATLEFDVYIPSSGNTVNLQIYNGSKADSNTAFILQFNPSNGLSVYNDSWETIAANAKLTANKWNKVRIEVTGGEESVAKIYLNGKCVGTTLAAFNKKDFVNGLYIFTGGATQSCYIDNLKVNGTLYEGAGNGGNLLLEAEMGELFDIADNTETEGLPVGDPIIKEDFRASFGQYGYTQIPNILYDPDTDLVYVNYNRHRDTIVDHPYDSTRVYDVQTILNAQAGAQLQKEYVDMMTEDSMFFCAMVKLKDGRIFCQNYPTYYLTDTTSTTYSWIIDTDGNWTKVEGILTLPEYMCYEGPQPTTTWGRYGFTRTMIELDDGTLLATMYGSYGAVMVESKDEGKTWNYRSTIADSALGLDQPYINTDGTDITWFEPSVARCADGSLLCVMRTWRNKPLWQTRSYDDGKTWSEPILMPGMEGKSIYPHLLLLSNGVMAMATGVPGDTIYFSLDGCGYNWDYCITTYSGDTTGNSGITELDYDEATGTVTLVAVGDRGFNNMSLSGVWGRLVKVTRNHVEDPKLASAVIRSEESRLAPGESLDVRVETVFDSDANVIGEGYDVEWYSLTPIIATMDQSGKLTAKNVGTAEVQAVVSYEGKMVMTNTITVVIREREVLDSIEVTPTKWVLKPGQKGSLTCEAFNYFGQEFVSGKITMQEYINGNINEPKFLEGDVKWTFESENPELLVVDPETGDYQALQFGTVDLVVTATKDDITLVRKVTMVIEGNQWVMEDFESGEMPEGTIVTDYVSVSDNRSWSGKYSLCLDDDSTTLTPTIRYPLPESRGIIVEFMIFTESVEHSPTFGIGSPREDGVYNYLCNTVYIGLLNNPLTAAQGFQAFNGISWSYSNRANNIPHRQWNKVRLEVSTDKEAKFYVNGKLLHQPAVAAEREFINTLFFGSGGAAYTGDTIYIDDIRYMTFDEPESAMSLTEQELVYENENFYIENEFYFVDVDLEGVDLSTDAGLLVWTPTQFLGRKVEYDENFAIPGLVPSGDTGYYYAKSNSITARNLSDGFYYAGYVKLADGTYVYSEANLYSPNTPTLNIISNAQKFMNPEIDKQDLANAKLTGKQKEINWTLLSSNLKLLRNLPNNDLTDEKKQSNWESVIKYFKLAPEIPADKQVEKDTKVFGITGKTLQFETAISLAALYQIDDEIVSGAKDCGTIFWTAEQFAALKGVPGLDNLGDGMVAKLEQYGDEADIWVSVGPEIAAKDMEDEVFYILGYVVDADGNISYSGVMSYTVEQYIKNVTESTYTSPAMVELAKSLFAYERAEN